MKTGLCDLTESGTDQGLDICRVALAHESVPGNILRTIMADYYVDIIIIYIRSSDCESNIAQVVCLVVRFILVLAGSKGKGYKTGSQ